jgi:hypothetical protein
MLAEIYADAKFICLVRDPISWVKSHVNYFMNTNREALQSNRIDNGFPFDLPSGNQHSRDLFLKNIDEYIEITFKSWANSYRSILNQTHHLSTEKYCFIDTNKISYKTDYLARFAGISVRDLIVEKAHSNISIYNVDVLKIVNPELIDHYYCKHCKNLMNELSDKL